MPGSSSSDRRTSSRSAPRSSATSPRRERGGQPGQGPTPRPRHRQRARDRRSASAAALGKRWVRPGMSVSTGRAVRGHEPAGDRPGADDADLLADDRARARSRRRRPARAPAGRGVARTSGPITGSPRELVVDRDRVAVGVDQPAGALDRGRGVAQVVQPELRRDEGGLPGGRRVVELEPDRAGSVRQVEGAGVPARRRPPRRPAPRGRRGSRAARRPANGVRTASRIVTVPGGGRAPPRAAAQLGRGGGVDLADRVVELADAGEPGREGDVGEAEVGGLDEHPRGLGAPGPGQRERAGAELGGEQPGRGGAGV